jgi:O-antigen/teichoic acid export membrane protein
MQNSKPSTTQAYAKYYKIERFLKFAILAFAILIACSIFMSHSMGSFSFIDWLVVASQKSNLTQIICGSIAYIALPITLSYLFIYRRKNRQA